MQKLNIGISMRESKALGYSEKRDSIARDWYRFMKVVLPNSNWILLPNIEKDIYQYTKSWKLNAFILTGGEDYGISVERDITEKLIFDYSQKNSLPILGICRGFQSIYKWLGGDLEKKGKKFTSFHNSTRHHIMTNNGINEVNSYHSNALIEITKPKELNVIARCKLDNTIEAYEGENILGFMWHPEREKKINEWDVKKIKSIFKYG